MAADSGDSDRVSHRAVIAFNDAINRRDLDCLRELMADGHAFIDSDDNVLVGKAEVVKAWEGFFSVFPDYRNDWSNVIRVGGTLIAVGRSVCSTEPAPAGPAIWTARTVGAKVSEWRVYEDTPANRRRLRIGDETD
jgi:ketosteroid isomerase-like protein